MIFREKLTTFSNRDSQNVKYFIKYIKYIKYRMSNSEINSVHDLFCTNPFVLILSDIHLGACDNLHEQFYKFLQLINQKIENKLISFLKVIIITGDFLDVMVDDCENLCKNPLHQNIFKEINLLLEKNIEIIFILGNHEIAVTGNFTKRKQKFLAEFSKSQSSFKAFREDAIAQYVIFESQPENHVFIKLYDNKQQLIHETPFKIIKIDTVEKYTIPKRFLFLHGHQFNPILNAIGSYFFWNYLLSAPGSTKRAIDHVWNKPGKKQIMKSPDEFDWRHRFVKRMINPKTISLKAAKMKLDLDAVIFGHSHQQLYTEERLNDNKIIQIVSNGAWQHVMYPGYVEISIDGQIKNCRVNITF